MVLASSIGRSSLGAETHDTTDANNNNDGQRHGHAKDWSSSASYGHSQATGSQRGKVSQSSFEDAKKLQIGYFFMVLHGIQFALQPMVTKAYVSDQCDKKVLVLVCELMKIVIALGLLLLQGK